ncbi:hypothetical protein [Celeribacter indicus]|uniref:Uncharacterized protein n=1 Tax=Celeribacter indicus TaxID=1208324 RepID=A0A0B5DU96_9RHOB|nr:hypothetical protein [Celeribacter indicus]AJE47023.1 hypothetical protein P73_2308 [Celeribacter indicus]SDW92697.1 hypothetical protein SAMN05443573_109128 [Celeribacter indicus]
MPKAAEAEPAGHFRDRAEETGAGGVAEKARRAMGRVGTGQALSACLARGQEAARIEMIPARGLCGAKRQLSLARARAT